VVRGLRRRGGTLAAVLGASLAVSSLPAAAPAAAYAGWSRTVRLSAPAVQDELPPALTIAPGGSVFASAGWFRADVPSAGAAWVSAVGPAGAPRIVPHAREVLGAGVFGGVLDLLAATAGHGRTCCGTVELLSLGPHGFTTPRPLLADAGGRALGALIPAGRGILAAFGSPGGVWVAQARPGGHFGPVHRLTPSTEAAQTLSAAPLSRGRTLLAWTAGPQVVPGTATPASIMIAQGTATHVPGPARAMLTLPAGHAIAELALLGAPAAPAVAWVDDSSSDTGTPVSAVITASLADPARRTTFPSPGIVSGLTGAADAHGDELLAWESCDPVPVCRVMTVSGTAGGGFGAPASLGTIDASSGPAVALSPRGAGEVGWISGGRVLVARRAGPSGRFGAPVRLAGDRSAANLTLAATPDGHVVAAWDDGLPAETVLSATFTP
jgi:hypothetical protein